MTRPPESAAFLRALPGCGFAPPEADVAALAPTLPAGGETAGRFAAEVREFAAAFWALPPAERAARWRALADRPVGPAAAWLAGLARGREVVPAAQPDPTAAEVAAAVRELFTLPPRARAARRVEWLTARAADFRRWSAVARTALRADPALARLDRELFDWFDAGRTPERIERQTWVAIRDRWRERRKRRKRIERILNPKVGTPSSLVILAALSVGFGLVRAWIDTPSATATNPGPRFSGAEVRAFRQYEGMDQPPRTFPPRYYDWVRAGRPEGTR